MQSSQPPQPWHGERDATAVDEKYLAIQRNLFNETVGSEDCLYLNVFTPHLGYNNPTLPVMVLIHGGGFILGNGIVKKSNGPNILIEQNIVFVSINYRLGVFGFLSLDIPEAAGNMGLKDQVAALKWVQENISVFGGDKNNVTIYGFSAGAASVQYHILSESSRGLFSKAILHSGSALNHWAIQYNIKELSLQLAKNIGFNGSSIDILEVYEYLMSQPMSTIAEEAYKLQTGNLKFALDFCFVPCVEKDFENNQAFLTQTPYKLLKEGKFNKVPIVTGFTEYEGILTQCDIPNSITKLKTEEIFTEFWKYPMDLEDIELLNKELRQKYFVENDVDRDLAVIEFLSDYDFVSGIITTAKIMADYNVPVYTYIFAYSGSTSMFKQLRKIDINGTVHCDDLVYIVDFELPGIFSSKFTDADALMKKKMSKMWTNFAKTG